MNLVIGATSLFGPLTGVGHYTLQLVRGLMKRSEIDSISLLAHGRLVPMAAALEVIDRFENAPENNQNTPESWLSKVRVAAAKNSLIVSLYDRVVPLMANYNMRHLGEQAIFHAPDFILPPFRGKKVVSILDLSTFNYPEFHPRARVNYINRQIESSVARADHIITISDYVKREIQERFSVPDDRISTTYLAPDEAYSPVDETAFRNDGRFPFLKYKHYFLSLGTIEPRKNLHRLLDAYEAYSNERGTNSLPLVVAGYRGWNSEDIHGRLNALGGQGQVHYLGYVDQASLPILVGGARALLFPSIYEGFGLPVVEAMRAGTAVLTSQDTAMSEIANDAALLVSPLETPSITTGLSEMDKSPEICKGLAEKGLRVSANLDWSRCLDSTLGVYSRLN